MLWDERSKTGASVCDAVANLARTCGRRVSPHSERLLNCLVRVMGDRNTHWQTVCGAARAAAVLCAELGQEVASRHVHSVRARLTELQKSHRVRNVRDTAMEALATLNGNFTEVGSGCFVR